MEHWKITGDLLTISFKGTRYAQKSGGGNKQAIEAFTDSSRRNMSRYLRCCVAEYRYFGTLTYGSEDWLWPEYKQHWARFVERCRRAGYLTPRDSIFWFVEFQARGAPHIHFFSTCHIAKYWLSKAWFESTGHCDRSHLIVGTNIQKLRSGRNGARAYAEKYARKNEQKSVPDMPIYKEKCFFSEIGPLAIGKKFAVGRWWGVTGRRDTESAATVFTGLSPSIHGHARILEIQNLMQIELNKAFEHKRAEIAYYSECKCVFFKDERTARRMAWLIRESKAAILHSLNAFGSRRERRNEHLRLKMLAESHVRPYEMAKHEAIYSESLVNAWAKRMIAKDYA